MDRCGYKELLIHELRSIITLSSPVFLQLMNACPKAPNRPKANALLQLDVTMEQLVEAG
jgi:hypothetical protein